MKVIKRYFNYFIAYVFNLINYFKSRRHRKISHDSKGNIYFDIRSNIYRRHLANLIFWLTEQGYKVYLKHRFRAIGSMKSFSSKIFRLTDLKITFKKPPGSQLIFSDKPSNKSSIIFLNPNYFNQKSLNHIPLGMQPDMYFNGYYKLEEKISFKKKRRIKIFFSGNLTEDLYSKKIIKTNFNKLTRIDILNILIKNFTKNLIIPDKIENLQGNDLGNKIVFNDRLKIMIPQNEFLDFLSDCSFFLFTPGVSHPICHNNFEAMAAGSIPILQYPEYFYPALENNKNSIVFNDQKELIKKISEVLKMSEDEIDKLRSNVIEYYQKYLKVKSIVDNIFEAIEKGEREFYLGLD